MYDVTVDPARTLVIARMGGLMTVDEVRGFESRKVAAARAMGARSGEFDLLVIAEGGLVQTQEVMAAFADLVLHSPMKSRRIATVREGALTKMQARRVTTVRGSSAVFDTVADADAWLAAAA